MLSLRRVKFADTVNGYDVWGKLLSMVESQALHAVLAVLLPQYGRTMHITHFSPTMVVQGACDVCNP